MRCIFASRLTIYPIWILYILSIIYFWNSHYAYKENGWKGHIKFLRQVESLCLRTFVNLWKSSQILLIQYTEYLLIEILLFATICSRLSLLKETMIQFIRRVSFANTSASDVTPHVRSSTFSCLLCTWNHPLEQYERFKDKDINERTESALQKSCGVRLKANHTARNRRVPRSCDGNINVHIKHQNRQT